MSKKIVAIVGTYRRGRVIETAVDQILAGAQERGVKTEKIMLADQQVKFCTNCRACTQQPGPQRGTCPIDDDVSGILDQLDAADGIVWASPINFGTVTAMMKRFIERLLCYAYWPWDVPKAPVGRIKNQGKPSVLLTASMCPAIIARVMMPGAFKTMKAAAKCVGGKIVGKLFFGLTAISEKDTLKEKQSQKAFAMGQRLAQKLESI